MKFRCSLTIEGYVDVEAETAEEAERIITEEGYSMQDFIFETDYDCVNSCAMLAEKGVKVE